MTMIIQTKTFDLSANYQLIYLQLTITDETFFLFHLYGHQGPPAVPEEQMKMTSLQMQAAQYQQLMSQQYNNYNVQMAEYQQQYQQWQQKQQSKESSAPLVRSGLGKGNISLPGICSKCSSNYVKCLHIFKFIFEETDRNIHLNDTFYLKSVKKQINRHTPQPSKVLYVFKKLNNFEGYSSGLPSKKHAPLYTPCMFDCFIGQILLNCFQ